MHYQTVEAHAERRQQVFSENDPAFYNRFNRYAACYDDLKKFGKTLTAKCDQHYY